MNANNDQDIIEAILSGDTKAFSVLINRYKDLVFTLAYRMLKNREEAEEVSQDTFIKVYKSLSTFKGDSKLSTWVYRIAYNKCLDTIKKNKKYSKNIEINEITFNKLDTIDNALDKMIVDEKHRLIRNCVNQLSANDSALITLFYFEELSLEDISKIVKIEANTIKVKLFRARKKLASILETQIQPQNSLNYESP